MSALARTNGGALLGAVACGLLLPSAALATGNPANSIPPDPDFTNTCSSTTYDNTQACTNLVLQAIANGRAMEQVPPMVLPSDWDQLTPTEQLFVATNLEIVDRGLPAMQGMATALDQDAQGAAVADGDPSEVPNGFQWNSWGGNWAGGDGSPLEAIYFWMYDDGLHSGNLECTQSDQTACWGHRDNILGSYQCPCWMGTGYALDFSEGDQNLPDWTEILLGGGASSEPTDLAWSQVTPYLTSSSSGSTTGATSSSSGQSTASFGTSTDSTSSSTGTTVGSSSGGAGATATTTGGSSTGSTSGQSTSGTSTSGSGLPGFTTTGGASSSTAQGINGGCSSGPTSDGLLGLIATLGAMIRRRSLRPRAG